MGILLVKLADVLLEKIPDDPSTPKREANSQMSNSRKETFKIWRLPPIDLEKQDGGGASLGFMQSGLIFLVRHVVANTKTEQC